MNKTTCFVLLPVLLLLGTSCTVFQPNTAQQAATNLPEQFSGVQSPSTPANTTWWEEFHSPELNALIDQALTNNFSVLQAAARLRQARELAVQAGAALIPSVNLSAGAGVTRAHATTDDITLTTDSEDYSLSGLAASYEVDLWGRVRSVRNAQQQSYRASAEDLAATMVTIAGTTADTWFGLLSTQARRDLLERQNDINTRLVDLLERRRRLAQSTALAVYQQQQIAAATASQLPLVEAQLPILTNTLNILIGQLPGSALPVVPSASTLPDLPALPPSGIPADLLTNRPDIRAAWNRLDAAGWNLAAAQANRLPALRLSGTASYSADAIDALFDNWVLNLASGLTAPLIDGGMRRSEVRRQQALLDEQLSRYRETVYTAVAEVENALQRELQQQRHLEALRTELHYSQLALSEAEKRYRAGGVDYLNVLSALNTTQSLEREVLSANYTLLSYRIALYRALGASEIL